MSGCILLKARTITKSRGRGVGKSRILSFDAKSRVIQRDGYEVARLAPQEAILLEMLVEEAPSVVSLESIVQRLWSGKPTDSSLQRIRDLIKKLREILEDSAS